jgi:hypothetical protein
VKFGIQFDASAEDISHADSFRVTSIRLLLRRKILSCPNLDRADLPESLLDLCDPITVDIGRHFNLPV